MSPLGAGSESRNLGNIFQPISVEYGLPELMERQTERERERAARRFVARSRITWMACNEMQINIFIDAVNIDAARARGGSRGKKRTTRLAIGILRRHRKTRGRRGKTAEGRTNGARIYSPVSKCARPPAARDSEGSVAGKEVPFSPPSLMLRARLAHAKNEYSTTYSRATDCRRMRKEKKAPAAAWSSANSG